MGMSTGVVGFKPPDDKWKAMKAVWDACKAAGVPAPKAVEDYFGEVPPDESGVYVSQRALEKAGAVRNYTEDSQQGFEVLLDKLPKDVTIIRFYNSW